jgi:hypothetical protein
MQVPDLSHSVVVSLNILNFPGSIPFNKTG